MGYFNKNIIVVEIRIFNKKQAPFSITRKTCYGREGGFLEQSNFLIVSL
jgi:hypothetical protein